MNSPDFIHMKFKWPYNKNLSKQTVDYLQSLGIEQAIDIYLAVPNDIKISDEGWAFVQERAVFIQPRADLKEFELRLAHEVTHIALIDQGYKQIMCVEKDDLDCAFANLLHHIVLYPRLYSAGFSLQDESNIVMGELNNRIKEYEEISTKFEFAGGVEYSIILMMNDLLRLTELDQDEYIFTAKKIIPELLDRALSILYLIKDYKENYTVKDYIHYKMTIEYNLGLGTYKWL